MTTLHLTTRIKAPCHIVFDIARNIDIHQQSATNTKEKAIAGKTSGLIELGETVTWKGKHFGFYIKHQSIISKMKYPSLFVDEQLKGHFKTFKHTHLFEEQNGVTIMQDILEYETPYGIFGKLFDKLFLKKHLKNFLIHRNTILKRISEKE
ncbi:MAG: cell division protein [Flavobacterium sp.]|uniref:SRPBCC family protein n=1 Tax=unclassified Flavobacterium TaxID=196869 RepID=UPI000C65B3E4|nr:MULTISPECIES: SRPBCC family protein [unclassified Flavobacterium]MBF03805.1 cell division protein [Flavobacterium sp.]MCO6164393.1 SRPBCC family protein [Flavobacterium sp. NRK F7]|tara:strand:+ start:436 stop:888 length:453 start_codon:yes stop_codon:yes gene_type:complete